MSRYFAFAALAAGALVAAGLSVFLYHRDASSASASALDFNRDIRPILNQNCTSCHGGVKQQGGVSFVTRDGAFGKGKSGRAIITPGRAAASELVARLTSTDPELRMPYHAPPLPQHQIKLLRQWIDEGAHWEDPWAFIPPRHEEIPAVKTPNWARGAVDHFILARLERAGLPPSPEADRAEQLRRVTFDLTGLPPTPDDSQAFLDDQSPDAYERQVDRLLASSHFGERWASVWLDLSRYADSKGFDVDRHHTAWPYRDWLIDAFNRNMPYDQFATAQLAGDLLPNATLNDRIATAFNRLTPTNDEGGTDDEEFRLVAVMDRVATTWSVFNGITMNCVQCHSHPYDPIPHRDYYTSLAFFNTSRDGDFFDEAPLLRVPVDRSRDTEVLELQKKVSSLQEQIINRGRGAAEKASWMALPITEATVREDIGLQNFLGDLEQCVPPMGEAVVAISSPEEWRHACANMAASVRKRLADLKASSPPSTALAVREGQMEVVGSVPEQVAIEVTAPLAPGILTALRFEVPPKNANTARHTPEVGFIVDRTDAWLKHAGGREERIAFQHFVPDSDGDLQTQVELADFSAMQQSHSRPAREAPGRTGGFAAYTKLARVHWLIGIPVQPIDVAPGDSIKVQITQTQVIAKKPATVPRLRLSASRDKHWTSFASNSALLSLGAQLTDARRQLASIPTLGLPVMEEQSAYERRQTLIFERGNFLAKTGDPITPDVPSVFPRLPQGAKADRLALARWLFTPGQPLTARVAVNRYWEQLFGIGLVETLENFGSVGEPPSHPDLLDWLALHFQYDLHWDTKALLRELVTSATYRQSSRATPELQAKDPRNRLLSRGPHQRLTAEMVRDQALLASGLLSSKMGGPSVMPPQPPGIWKNVANSAQWIDAIGEDRYRRALYTFIKRSAMYPSFLTFDAAAHDVSLARRIPTNTPLQALVTLNDPVYHEAVRALAIHWLNDINAPNSEHGDVLDARLTDGAWRILSRDLTAQERAELRSLYEKAIAMAETQHRAQSSRLRTISLRHAPPRESEPLSALTAVAKVLLNLDAALTR